MRIRLHGILFIMLFYYCYDITMNERRTLYTSFIDFTVKSTDIYTHLILFSIPRYKILLYSILMNNDYIIIRVCY